jgi:hypothetical protein
MCTFRELADAGCLMAYGPSVPASFRRAAYYVYRILKGAKLADLPVERVKPAKALGLTKSPRVTPPTWLDAQGRRRPTLACWTCGRETASMRLRAGDLQRLGWTPPVTSPYEASNNGGHCRATARYRSERGPQERAIWTILPALELAPIVKW